MTFDLPNIAVYVSIAFFYLKIVYMQWRKARNAAKKTNVEIAKARKQGKTPKIPDKPTTTQRFSIQITNWYLVAGTIGLVLVGFALHSSSLGLPAELTSLWWVLMAGGIVGLSFAIK
jgi:hypothetical protein